MTSSARAGLLTVGALVVGGLGAQCEQLGEGARGRLLEEAQGGRLTETALEGVPF